MNESFFKACLLPKNRSNCLYLLLLVFFSACTPQACQNKGEGGGGIFEAPIGQATDIHYGSGQTPYYNATRAVDYTRALADQLAALAPNDIMVGEARKAADDLEAAIKAMPYDPNAGGGQFLLRLTQALGDAGRQAGLVANKLEVLTGKPGIPPDFPNDPSFRQTFTSVHGSRGDR